MKLLYGMGPMGGENDQIAGLGRNRGRLLKLLPVERTASVHINVLRSYLGTGPNLQGPAIGFRRDVHIEIGT